MPLFDEHPEAFYWIGLKAVAGVGNVTFRRLLERFDTPRNALYASRDALTAVKGVTDSVADAIRGDAWQRFAEQECRQLATSGARLLTFTCGEYPKSLFEIPDPPPFLYVRGTLPAGKPCIAMVGSRRASTYGLLATGRLAEALAQHGVAVVSGMARGVDTAAHKGALLAGGSTIGVLGCGIDRIYPPENNALFGEMAEKGCLLSEFPLGSLPLAENFPRRNRIISGLSQGVLVVEATENSGSLITARYALEQGRDVFAVPGNINTVTSRGSNRLIKEGAKLVDCVEDILEELPGYNTLSGETSPAPRSFALTPREAAIYEILARSPLHIDDIISQSELTAGDVSSMLLHLELKGAVIPLPGAHYAIS
ncbi:DNA-processing protein DprA [Geobacter sp. SVR]|uniref:DNA-processing protein DprA n=1 Tax=Geobacter sp. SVR TaxID=2495594 RepID=UPI00143EFCEA|nr:DNA-processing protein DprA [Geobacter sp. SVR]BCS55658.1 DNA polymerase [Geobacter sp. SVR]GCF83662.1 DNA polymerase [Geobacter sp. SVR]